MLADPTLLGYFDTSALVKAYVEEEGTPLVVELLSDHVLVSSALAVIELGSALSRRRAADEITQKQLQRVFSRIDQERQHWTLITLETDLLAKAERLCREGFLRTLDAVHVASALLFRESSGLHIPFITADARQREAAAKLGLKVVWVA